VSLFPRGSGRPARLVGLWMVLVVVSVLAVQFYFGMRGTQVVDLTDTQFVAEVQKGNIQKLAVTPGRDVDEVHGELKTASPVTVSGRAVPIKEFRTFHSRGNAPLSETVWASNPGIEIVTRPATSNFWTAIQNYLPFVVLILAWAFMVRRMQAPKTES